MKLTPEQSAVVAHDHGPALVFAVAGAGKTTAMVHRIERLVRETCFSPQSILATSFSRASVADLKTLLQPWSHCQRVQVSTLHALGLKLIDMAISAQAIAPLNLNEFNQDTRILKRALGHARRQGLDIPTGFDEKDFLNYISTAKGNLCYPPEAELDLPPDAQGLVSTAEAPNTELDFYPILYRLFEAERQALACITFDDMLLLGWEIMHRFPELCARFQQRYACVLVDEFQDVNLAQYELLDLLTATHRNYMAIGDDDQTIYEWRGASPRFILDFPQRYQAQKFLMRDNFRSEASHLALANQIIVHNVKREPKQLQLTRGFEGQTHLHYATHLEQAGDMVAEAIRRHAQQGVSLKDMAILLRIYAQTPYLEHSLIQAKIPYQIMGSKPFYQRKEVKVFLGYLTFALYENQTQQGQVDARLQDQVIKLWPLLANQPLRYFTAPLMAQVKTGLQTGRPLTHILHDLAEIAEPVYLPKYILELSDLIAWLAIQIQFDDTASVLMGLEEKLGFCEFLRKHSGFPQTGESRAATIEALIDYSRGKGRVLDFRNHLLQLTDEYRALQALDTPKITLTTIYRAKGLEWPVVIVPHCNQGYIPYGGPAQREEERRLFYVALTRPQAHLHLLLLKDKPPSQFLIEARYEEVLKGVELIRAAMKQRVETWQTREYLNLARYSPMVQFEGFLTHWWQASPTAKRQIVQHIQALFERARKEGLLEALQLNPEDESRWQELLPSGEISPLDIGDLQAMIPPSPQRSVSPFPKKVQAVSFEVGQRIRNSLYGEGAITAVQVSPQHGVLLDIEFEQVGPKKLISKYADLQVI